jgi:V/A-type H+/Na+-transporting ATPase subunit I
VLAPIAKVQIVGRQPYLEAVLARMYDLRLLQIEAEDVSEFQLASVPGADRRAARAEELRLLMARLGGLLSLDGGAVEHAPRWGGEIGGAPDLSRLREELDTLSPQLDVLLGRIEELEVERVVLPRYIAPLRRLLPLVPELAELDEGALRALQLETIALVLETDDDRVIETLRVALTGVLGERFELVAVRVDPHAVGCVIVFSHRETEAVHTMLGRERVRAVPLPSGYERLSFHGAVTAMDRRLAALPADVARARAELHELLAPRVAAWRAAQEALTAQLEQVEAVAELGATSRTFVVSGWAERAELPRLRLALEHAAGGELVLDELPHSTDRLPPVLLRNRQIVRPFEFLVRFLDLPHAGSLDPTLLLALVLPVMVGAMVGDVAYGALLLAASLIARRRFGSRSAAARDLCDVFVAGSIWAIGFGFLFGEALGDIGHRLGLPALWFYRGGPDAVEPLLLFSLVFGAAHVTLGLLLGLWRSAKTRRTAELLGRGGLLLALCGVAVLAGVATDRLALFASVPAGATIVGGLALLVVPRGVLGLLMGPLELIGALGNILSYLRVAAVGLASAYLAVVANRLGGLGPVWIGVPVAAFFHALNLALASFSPMIQALRLHYVEFFSKFFEDGGQPFRPFGEQAGRVALSTTD